MEAKHWGLRKSRNATSLNSRFKSLDTLKVKIISVTFRRVIRTNHKKRSEERFSRNAETELVCRLLLEKKKRWCGRLPTTAAAWAKGPPPRTRHAERSGAR